METSRVLGLVVAPLLFSDLHCHRWVLILNATVYWPLAIVMFIVLGLVVARWSPVVCSPSVQEKPPGGCKCLIFHIWQSREHIPKLLKAQYVSEHLDACDWWGGESVDHLYSWHQTHCHHWPHILQPRIIENWNKSWTLINSLNFFHMKKNCTKRWSLVTDKNPSTLCISGAIRHLYQHIATTNYLYK